MKQDIQDIQNGIEKILSKYYWHFNTEEIREAISNEIKFYLRSKKVGKKITCKEVGIDANKGTINVTLFNE
jgi:hypothetical protein